MAIPMTEEEKKRRLVMNSRRPVPTFAGAESVAVAPDARRPVLPVDQLGRKVPSNDGLGAMMGVAGFQNPLPQTQAAPRLGPRPIGMAISSFGDSYGRDPSPATTAIRPVAARSASVATDSAPLVGPVPDVDRARRDILDSDRRRMLGNRAAQLLRTPPVPNDAAGSGGRIDSILEATRARDHAEGANRAPQRELSAEEMQAGRADLLKQGLANADIMRQRATSGMDAARARGDAAGVNALQPELDTAVAVEGGMNRAFGTPLTPEQIAQRQAGQKATIARQKAMQEANAMLAEEEAARENGVIASRRGLETASRGLGLKTVQAASSGMDRTIAENQSAADPAVLAAGRAALLARGQTEALRARTESQQAEAAAAEAGATSGAAIATAPQLNPDFQSASGRVLSTLTKFGAGGGQLGANRDGEVGQFSADVNAIISYIDSLPDGAQKASAKQNLSAVLVAQGGLGDESGSVGDWVIGGLDSLPRMSGSPADKRNVNSARYRAEVNRLKSYLLGQ